MPQHNTKYAAYTKQAHKHTGRNFRARVCVYCLPAEDFGHEPWVI